MEIKHGSRVRIHKCENPKIKWNDKGEMDRFDGMIGTVTKVMKDQFREIGYSEFMTGYRVRADNDSTSTSWIFSADCLQVIGDEAEEECKKFEPKPGETVYNDNYTIKVIDWNGGNAFDTFYGVEIDKNGKYVERDEFVNRGWIKACFTKVMEPKKDEPKVESYIASGTIVESKGRQVIVIDWNGGCAKICFKGSENGQVSTDWIKSAFKPVVEPKKAEPKITEYFAPDTILVSARNTVRVINWDNGKSPDFFEGVAIDKDGKEIDRGYYDNRGWIKHHFKPAPEVEAKIAKKTTDWYWTDTTPPSKKVEKQFTVNDLHYVNEMKANANCPICKGSGLKRPFPTLEPSGMPCKCLHKEMKLMLGDKDGVYLNYSDTILQVKQIGDIHKVFCSQVFEHVNRMYDFVASIPTK